MIGWLALTDEQRRISLEQASVRSGIQVKAIEKDWWVTLCLKALFTTEYASHCVFKGGTSLSKGWKLIQRFSEDIDIALDPAAFGMEYVATPSHNYVKQLKRKGCVFTSTNMKAAMETTFAALGLPEGTVVVEAEPIPEDMPDKDPETLFVRYRSLFDPHPYLADEVKIEFSVRSLREPFAKIQIQSILSEYFPNPAYGEIPFAITAVEPRKTLLEKLFLLHEKLHHPYPQSIQDDRQSRHLYDIVQLMETEAGEHALKDVELYTAIIAHRRHYARIRGVDYDAMQPAKLNFVPPAELLDFFHADYERMQQSMIYGDTHMFEELMSRLKWFNVRVRLIGTNLTPDDLINTALAQNESIGDAEEYKLMKLPVVLQTINGETIHCRLLVWKRRGKWVFETLEIKE